jgi:very-short-patch-repair endonuclease
VRGVCEKPRIKCAECPNRRFLPVTDDVIRWHLSGHDAAGQPFVAGVYPLLQDETCFFLAVDFDKAGWREDAAAFLEACRHLDLPAALERSRSGRGAHVWFFFEEAIPATLARRLGSHVLTETMEGRSPLILTERNEHLDCFERELASRVQHVVVLRAGMGKKRRQAVNERLAAIPRDEGRIIVATGKYVGEGFDDPRLNTLFLTLPVSWRGTVAQYAGRLHRLYDGKREVRIYDYADLNVPMLARMFDRRCRGYEAIGYTILLPASAVPGWPADVVLPSDPVWKQDYSGSVRRLIRDGVDTPLASLFVHTARAMPEDAEGAARARSASEAFLYRRLDTLAETNGRFRLNVSLPIPFDGFGTLEVDLLCADARVAIELDGGKHLTDPIAYRRDRRKDQLLQENGYFVLRFLAEDVGKELDAALDAVLRVLARRRQARAEPLKFVLRGGE